MQVSVETTSGLERRLTIAIPSQQIDSEVESRLKKASKTVKINGFRKGKIPLKVVKQRYGEGVRQEVVGDAINKSFYEAVQKEALRPAGQPQIEPKSLNEGTDLEFIATFEVYPEIELQDMKGVELTSYDADIADTDVDEMIETLRKSQSSWDDVKRKAKKGDRILIDYVGKVGGEVFEGGSAEGQWLELGSDSMIPGFEKGLIGVKTEDEITLELKFPDDYQVDSLKGADAVFDVKVHQTQGQKLPKIDAAFFEKFGVKDGNESKFREDVKGNMEREKKGALRAKIKEQAMEAFLSAHKIDIPSSLVKSEIDVLRNQAMQQYGAIADKIDVKALLPDDIFKAQAEKRTALGLLVSEYVQVNKITADKDKIRAIIEETASTYENPEEVVNYYYSNQQLLNSAEAAALEDQVIDKLLEDATVTDVKVSYEEAIKPLEKAEQ